MALSEELAAAFVKVTKDAPTKQTETIVYGTIVNQNDVKCVRFDGSEILTPLSSTTNIEDGERVMVTIKNHSAIITGNITSPAARTVEVTQNSDAIGALTETVTTVSSSVEKNAEEIKTLVTKTEFENAIGESNTSVGDLAGQVSEMDKKIEEAESIIQQQNQILASKVDKNDYDSDMAGKADSKSVSDLIVRVEKAESSITQTAESISLKVDKTTYEEYKTSNDSTVNSLSTRVSKAESSITQTSESIASKVDKITYEEYKASNDSAVSGLTSRIEDAESSIEQTSESISLKVDKTTYEQYKASNDRAVDSLSTRVTKAESSITQTEEQIALKVSETEMTDAINSVQVGGRNLLLNSGVEVSNASGIIRRYTPSTPLVAGEEYTVSLCITPASDVTNLNVRVSEQYSVLKQLYVNGFSKQILQGTFIASYASGKTPEDNISNADVLLMRSPLTGTSNTVVHWIKIEKGNKATDWSPAPEDPAHSVKAESSVTITKDKVHISTSEFEVSIPSEDGDSNSLIVNEDGLTSKWIVAPNIAQRYSGSNVISVNPSATQTEIDAGSTFRSLGEVFVLLNNKHIDSDIEINCASGCTMYGNYSIHGTCGGAIRIRGNNAILYGAIVVENCTGTINFSSMSIMSSERDALSVYGCSYVSVYECTIASETGRAVAVTDGSKFLCDYTTLIASADGRAAYISSLSYAVFNNNKGSGALVVRNAIMAVSGTVPSGGYENWGCSFLDSSGVTGESEPDVDTPVIEETTTFEFPMVNSDSYCGGWSWTSDNDIRQGYVNSRKIHGVVWFDNSSIRATLASKTVKQASLRLYMHSGVGRGVGVAVKLYGTDKAYSGRSGEPDTITSYGSIGTTKPGELNELTIPVKAVNDILYGITEGLVFLSDDSAPYSDRFYSRNYAKFSGETSCTDETRPMLIVTCQ